MSAFTLFAILAIAAAWLEHQNRELISTQFEVVDGDSLKAEGLKIRLVGIDAPEYDQVCENAGGIYNCGKRSREHLIGLLRRSGSQNCFGEGRDKYDRVLAECFADATNLNAAMVASGWAIAYGDYGRLEALARMEKRGLWSGKFDRPDRWRAKNAGLVEHGHWISMRGVWRRVMNWILPLEGTE